MSNYFDNEIKQLDRELLDIKTSGQKSSSVVPTVAKTFKVDIDLKLTSLTDCSGLAEYKVITPTDSLMMVTLDKYYDDISQSAVYPRVTRETYWFRTQGSDGVDHVNIETIGTRADAETLAGGGTVTVTTEVTIRCTNNFTVERISDGKRI